MTGNFFAGVNKLVVSVFVCMSAGVDVTSYFQIFRRDQLLFNFH